MTNFNEKKAKLLNVKKRLLRMPNTIEKVSIASGYFNLLCFFRETENLPLDFEIEDDFILKYIRYVISNTEKNLNEVDDNARLLLLKYQQIIDTYKECEFCSYDYADYAKVNRNKMYSLVSDFFALLGEDVLKIYYDMAKNENILLSNKLPYAGVSYNANPIDNPYIIIQNYEKYFEYYFTLVHEMGHCYQFYLQRNQCDFASFSPLAEITSLLFEKMFAEYLKSVNVLKTNYYDILDHVYLLNDVSASKILCQLLINRDVKEINPFDLSYSTKTCKDKLLKQMMDDCGYIMPNKYDLDFTEFHYSIGNIIATNFNDKLKNNFNAEWKNFKEFICTMNYLPLKEIIDEYLDVDLIKTKIKEFTKSYYGR